MVKIQEFAAFATSAQLRNPTSRLRGRARAKIVGSESRAEDNKSKGRPKWLSLSQSVGCRDTTRRGKELLA